MRSEAFPGLIDGRALHRSERAHARHGQGREALYDRLALFALDPKGLEALAKAFGDLPEVIGGAERDDRDIAIAGAYPRRPLRFDGDRKIMAFDQLSARLA